MTDALADLVGRLRAAGCVFAEEEAALVLAQAAGPDEVERLVRAREQGLPLEQVLGWAALAGVRVVLEPGVFVPRRRTGLMVEVAVELVGGSGREPVVLLDLCCGSGAVAAAVTRLVDGRRLEVTAADLDEAAVRCAARNLPAARVLRSDLFADLPADLRGRVDVLTANVPYVPTADVALMPREARDHEPRLALDGGVDGLDLLRRVAAEAPAWLAPGGSVLFETAERQQDAACSALGGAGLAVTVRTDEDLGATVVMGSRSGGPAAGGGRVVPVGDSGEGAEPVR